VQDDIKLKIEEVESEIGIDGKNDKITYCHGNVIKKQEQKNGVLDGLETRYHLNGQIMSITNYNNGTKDGDYNESNSSGQLVETGFWEDGQKHIVKEFFSNGNLKTEINYEFGTGIRYKQDGNFDMSWEDMGGDRVGIKKETKTGGYIKWCELNGVKDGLMIERNQTGSIVSRTKWKSGKLSGKNIYFYDNGYIKNELIYDSGVKTGPSITYYESGEVDVVCNYSSNLLQGKYMKFSKDGSIHLYGDYKHGKEYYQGEYRHGKLIDVAHCSFFGGWFMGFVMWIGLDTKETFSLKKNGKLKAPLELKQ
jgi:antitoxin component YwqK of YwqJK toxin-antitoxin module